MSVLVTGATGKTGAHLVQVLRESHPDINVVALSRPIFDWLNPSTFESVFDVSPAPKSAYLIAPINALPHVLEPMKPFIDLAVNKGVKRLVLLSGATLQKGDLAMGKVHEYLVSEEMKAKGVEAVILRPSYFFENFTTVHSFTIKQSNTIVSAKGNGKMGFVSAYDIAETAAGALTAEKVEETDIFITGPEPFSYDEVAEIFSGVLGRAITHTRVSEDTRKRQYMAFGIEEDYAAGLAKMEAGVALGAEQRVFENPKAVKGKKRLRDFIVENKDVWI